MNITQEDKNCSTEANIYDCSTLMENNYLKMKNLKQFLEFFINFKSDQIQKVLSDVS